MENSSYPNTERPRPYLMLMGILASACTGASDLKILDRVRNKSAIDRSVELWTTHPDHPEVRNEALIEILSCARDSSANDESRAYCLQVLNGLSGKSDQVLEEINGLILPARVSKLAKVIEKMESKKIGAR